MWFHLENTLIQNKCNENISRHISISINIWYYFIVDFLDNTYRQVHGYNNIILF